MAASAKGRGEKNRSQGDSQSNIEEQFRAIQKSNSQFNLKQLLSIEENNKAVDSK